MTTDIELREKVSSLETNTKHILKELIKISSKIDTIQESLPRDLEKKIGKFEKIQTRHSVYWKIIGSILTVMTMSGALGAIFGVII